MYFNSGRSKYAVMSQMHCAQPTIYKFFCFKINKSKLTCICHAKSTKLIILPFGVTAIMADSLCMLTTSLPRNNVNVFNNRIKYKSESEKVM